MIQFTIQVQRIHARHECFVWAKVFNNATLLLTWNELAQVPTDSLLGNWTVVYDTLYRFSQCCDSSCCLNIVSKSTSRCHLCQALSWNEINQISSPNWAPRHPIVSVLCFIHIQPAPSVSAFHTRTPSIVCISSNTGIRRSNIKKCLSEDVPFNPSLVMQKIQEKSN